MEKMNSNIEVFLNTLRIKLQDEGEDVTAELLRQATIKFIFTSLYSSKKWNQFKVFIDIRVPADLICLIEHKKDKIYSCCLELFEQNEDYLLADVRISVLLNKYQIDEDMAEICCELIEILNEVHMDSITRKYFYEACICAANDKTLSALTMLSSAAERLFMLHCEAYLVYLEEEKDSEQARMEFKEKVLKELSINDKIANFQEIAYRKENFLKLLGLENQYLLFDFFAIIKEVRSKSGYPGGVTLDREQLRNILKNVLVILNQVHSKR